MSESSPIKDALYAKIDDIGQERIHKLMLNGKFSELFEKIYETTINSIDGINEYEQLHENKLSPEQSLLNSKKEFVLEYVESKSQESTGERKYTFLE